MAARQSPADSVSPFTPGAWTQQDGVIVTEPLAGRSHIGHRWDKRCCDGWEGYDVRAAWREGDPVDYGDDEVAARLHADAGLVLVCRFGFVSTVIPAADAGFEVAQPDADDSSSGMRFMEDSR